MTDLGEDFVLRHRLFLVAVLIGFLVGCGSREEVSVADAQALKAEAENEVLAKTVKKPGGAPFALGLVGGTFIASVNNDPKTFNTLTARDADTRNIIDNLFDYLADYDPYLREFRPNLASFEIDVDEPGDRLTVTYTLRDDLYWTTPGSPQSEWVKVTSDDVVFWYNEVEGDKSVQHPGYPGQFIELANGKEARIEIEKLDELRFAFHYPRIVANPILSTNSTFGPYYMFAKAKKEGGVEAMLNLLSVDTDPKTIPSVGQYHITEYSPGVRVVLKRNPNHWKKDATGTSYPYVEDVIYKIVPDRNTEFLLFKQGDKDAYDSRPEDLSELVNKEPRDYTVYNGGESLGSAFFAFNQNPGHMDPLRYKWFSQTRFRQAMSSMLNRPRIVEQVYRGLAVPAHHFFARPNPFFDENIKLKHTYNPTRAVELLAEIGIKKGDDGLMYDADGNHIEFDINMGAENNIGVDIANIFSDELKEIGITANVRPIDFQKLVEMLISTYDWHCATVSLGSNYWPSGGSNVWQSNGNFHLWHPLQEEPATEWERRIDYLYNEGRFTIDKTKAKEIYDEYQELLLDQVPMIYIVHPLSFSAVRDRWDNVFYDTLNGMDTKYLFLKE